MVGAEWDIELKQGKKKGISSRRRTDESHDFPVKL